MIAEIEARHAVCDDEILTLLPEVREEAEVERAEEEDHEDKGEGQEKRHDEDPFGPVEAWPCVCLGQPLEVASAEFIKAAETQMQHDLEEIMQIGPCKPRHDVLRELSPLKEQKTMKSVKSATKKPVLTAVAHPVPTTKPTTTAGAEPVKTKKPLVAPTAEAKERLHVSPAQPGGTKLFGPEPGVRHKTFGVEPPDEHGHLRLVTHPVQKNVQYNKGVGVETFEVDGCPLPGAGVVER